MDNLSKYLSLVFSIPGISISVALLYYVALYMLDDDDFEETALRNSSIVGICVLAILYARRILTQKFNISNAESDVPVSPQVKVPTAVPSAPPSTEMFSTHPSHLTDKLLGIPTF
jgi:hypothetical protein